jgi:AGCS family alanine or glycine:cation symporter
MHSLDIFTQHVVELVWGLPLVILIAGASMYFSYLSRLLPLRGILHAFRLLRGKYDNPDPAGEISHAKRSTITHSCWVRCITTDVPGLAES